LDGEELTAPKAAIAPDTIAKPTAKICVRDETNPITNSGDGIANAGYAKEPPTIRITNQIVFCQKFFIQCDFILFIFSSPDYVVAIAKGLRNSNTT